MHLSVKQASERASARELCAVIFSYVVVAAAAVVVRLVFGMSFFCFSSHHIAFLVVHLFSIRAEIKKKATTTRDQRKNDLNDFGVLEYFLSHCWCGNQRYSIISSGNCT